MFMRDENGVILKHLTETVLKPESPKLIISDINEETFEVWAKTKDATMSQPEAVYGHSRRAQHAAFLPEDCT